MLDYYGLIKLKYTDIDDSNFSLQDNGSGVFVSFWDWSTEPPVLADLVSEAEIAYAISTYRNELITLINNRDSFNWYYIRKVRTGEAVPEEIDSEVDGWQQDIDANIASTNVLIAQIPVIPPEA